MRKVSKAIGLLLKVEHVRLGRRLTTIGADARNQGVELLQHVMAQPAHLCLDALPVTFGHAWPRRLEH